MSKIVVWSKDHCGYCTAAINLLESYNLDIEIRKIGTGEWTREQLLEAVPTAKTVPQIIIDNKIIGGYTELRTYIEETGFNGTGYTL